MLHLCILLSLFLLAGCGSKGRQDSSNTGLSANPLSDYMFVDMIPVDSEHAAVQDDLIADEIEMEEVLSDVEEVPPEPEETVELELQELEILGSWEEGMPAVEDEAVEVEYDFPITINRQVEYYLDFFQNRNRVNFDRWLARSGAYLPMIKEKLRKAGLPQDLAYLAMIESGFSQTARSRARAVGLWQFISATGRRYDLKINTYIDERRNPVKSTDAAVEYLSDLYEEFDSWYLAVAGYNAGEGKIRRAVKKYKTNNFWELAQRKYLKLETKRYVPKLIAAIIVSKNPEKYGFSQIEYAPPLAYDVFETTKWTSLKSVALACGTEVDELRKLNRELLKPFTPPKNNSYQLRIPVGKKAEVKRNLPRVHAVVSTKYKTHVVKKGESLSRVCRKYGLTKTIVLKVNNLHSARLEPGQRLRVPYRTTDYELLPEGAVAPHFMAKGNGDESFILHKVRPGETVSGIASRYNVPAHLIAGWNDLRDISRIRAGQQLALYVLDSGYKSSQPNAKRSNSKFMVKIEDLKGELEEGREMTYYTVRRGDSLWTISRRHNISMEEIRIWNNLDDNNIYPGNSLLLVANTHNYKENELQPEPDTPTDEKRVYYKVRRGDSLWTIARKFDISAEKIRKLNNLDNNLIHPGSKLLLADNAQMEAEKVSHSKPVTPSDPKGVYYRVRRGDSLWTIARKFKVSSETIRKLNNLDNNLIHPGTNLMIAKQKELEATRDSETRTVSVMESKGIYYRVRGGDSLWTISRKFNLSMKEIRTLNNLKNDVIYPGNRLLVKSSDLDA